MRLIRGAEENRTTQKVRIGSVTVDLGEQAKCAMDMHAYRYISACAHAKIHAQNTHVYALTHGHLKDGFPGSDRPQKESVPVIKAQKCLRRNQK